MKAFAMRLTLAFSFCAMVGGLISGCGNEPAAAPPPAGAPPAAAPAPAASPSASAPAAKTGPGSNAAQDSTLQPH